VRVVGGAKVTIGSMSLEKNGGAGIVIVPK
jgi:hypothetical protein